MTGHKPVKYTHIPHIPCTELPCEGMGRPLPKPLRPLIPARPARPARPSQEPQCSQVPQGYCAVLFSDGSCNGRAFYVFFGPLTVAQTRAWLRWNHVGSLSVKAGCTLVGHEAENGRGRGISISADIFGDHHVADLAAYKHIYDGDIQSAECRCYGGNNSRDVSVVGGNNTRDMSVVGGNNTRDVSVVGGPDSADCPTVSLGTCGVMYSEEGCLGQRKELSMGTKVVREDPLSVSVAAGCTLTGFEAGHRVSVRGEKSGKHVTNFKMFLKLHGAVSDLETVTCECEF